MIQAITPTQSTLPNWARQLFLASLTLYLLVLPVGKTVPLRYLGFTGLIVATLALLWKLRQKPLMPLLYFWLFYALAALLSLPYAIDVAYSSSEIRLEVAWPFLIFVVATTWSYFAAGTLTYSQRVLGLGNVILVGACLVLWLVGDSDPLALVQKTSINMGSGTYSTYVVTVFPVLAYTAWRLWQARRVAACAAMLLLCLANIVTLFLSWNRQSFVAIVAAAVVVAVFNWRYFIGSRRRIVIMLVTLIAVVALFGFQMQRRGNYDANVQGVASMSKDVRFELWEFAYARISEHPLRGAGFGRRAFALAYPDFADTHPMLWHAHNVVLNKGIQMGWPGIISFCALMAALGVTLWRYRSPHPEAGALVCVGLAMLVSVLIKNMTDDFFVRDGALLFWLLAGLIVGRLRALYDEARPAV